MNKTLMPLGQLFNKSFETYKSKFQILTKISALNFLVFIVMAPFIGFFVGLNFGAFFMHAPANLMSILVGTLFLLVGILIAIILGAWISASLYFAVKDGSNQTKIKDIMPAAWKKAGSFFWVLFLAGLFTILGFILLVIPGIIFMVWMAFASYIFVFEDIRGVAALKKSREFARGYWWPLFGRILIIIVLSMIISSIRFLGLGPIINTLFFMPFSIVCLSEIYKDLKAIKA